MLVGFRNSSGSGSATVGNFCSRVREGRLLWSFLYLAVRGCSRSFCCWGVLYYYEVTEVARR